jgi:Transmembrane secretion effector
VTAVPLRRNRDFLLLQAGFLLSSAGSQISAIAYPLLVLALTGSAAKAGLVGFAGLVPLALFALPAGLAADRWNRRRVMLAAHAVRMVAIGTLASMILLDRVVFWAIPVIAFVQGAGNIVFSVTSAGALRSVVPPRQLPAAAAVVTGRDAAVSLAGPPLGGALFALGRALPFLVHAVSYVFATLALLAIRTPFQEQRDRDDSPLRVRLAQGFRFVWDHPFIRTCAFLYGLANFIGPGVLFAVVVIGRQDGLSGGQVGVLLGAFSGCILVGSLLSPLVRRVLPVRGVLLLELWTWPGCALFLVWPNVYVLTASLLPTALAIPSTNSVVDGYQLAMTPDRLIGRVESVRSTIALLIAPLGPLVAGLLLDAASARAAIAVFAAFGLLLAVWGTLSPSIRTAPSLDDVAELPSPAPAG